MTTHRVMKRQPKRRSLQRAARSCPPMATSASGIAVSRRSRRLYSVRNASCPSGRVRTEREDQRRHQRERQPRTRRAHAVSPTTREPTIASTMRRSPRLGRLDLVDDPAARHDDDAVTEPGELEGIARLDDDCDAFVRLRAQRLVDVETRADVDALRRLLREDQFTWPRRKWTCRARPSAGCRPTTTEPAARWTPSGCAAAARRSSTMRRSLRRRTNPSVPGAAAT